MSKDTIWDHEEKFKKALSKEYCLAPIEMKAQCSGGIIKAHTIPKQGSLSSISRNGKVYGYKTSFAEFKKIKDDIWEPSLIGIKKASIFTGFCSKHDDNIFSPIEKEPFESTDQQCFLFSYRSVCRELYFRYAITNEELITAQRERVKGKPRDEQLFLNDFLKRRERDNHRALIYIKNKKDIFDNILINNTYNNLSSYIVKFKKPTPVMCSGTFFPAIDFRGVKTQNLNNLNDTPEILILNSFASEGFGYIVLSWLKKEGSTAETFVESFANIDNESLTDAFITMTFNHLENNYISPDWWETLPQEQRISICRMFTRSIKPFAQYENLFHYSIGVLPWEVLSRGYC